MEENKIENNKTEEKKTNNLSLILTVVLCLVFGALGYYLGSRYAIVEKDGLDTNKPNEPVDIEPTTNPDVEDNDVFYVGSYVYGWNLDGENVNNRLYLKDDNTFSYYIADSGCGSKSAGTYAVSGNQIVLTETVHYGCDACFEKNNLKTITVNIKDNDNLVIAEQTYSKSSDVKADTRIVAYPVDGVTPEGYSEPWVDCTGNKK